MRTLYKAGNSICTQKVLITLREKGLQWEEHNINLFLNQQYDPAYLKLNPKGVVPTLVDDDIAIIESTLICEYLDDRYPEPEPPAGDRSPQLLDPVGAGDDDQPLHLGNVVGLAGLVLLAPAPDLSREVVARLAEVEDHQASARLGHIQIG